MRKPPPAHRRHTRGTGQNRGKLAKAVFLFPGNQPSLVRHQIGIRNPIQVGRPQQVRRVMAGFPIFAWSFCIGPSIAKFYEELKAGGT